MKAKLFCGMITGLLLLCAIGFAHADTITLVSDGSTLFSASGTEDLSAMDTAVQNGTYATPNLSVIVASQGTGIYQIPGTSIVNSNPSAYYYGLSGYYQTSFVLPSGFSNAALSLQAVGDDAGYAYLNGHYLGVFYWNGSSAYGFTTLDQSFFQSGTNLLTFAVSNYGGGPTGLSYSATVDYQPVPAPATFLLLGPGLVTLAAIKRRFNK